MYRLFQMLKLLAVPKFGSLRVVGPGPRAMAKGKSGCKKSQALLL